MFLGAVAWVLYVLVQEQHDDTMLRGTAPLRATITAPLLRQTITAPLLRPNGVYVSCASTLMVEFKFTEENRVVLIPISIYPYDSAYIEVTPIPTGATYDAVTSVLYETVYVDGWCDRAVDVFATCVETHCNVSHA